MLVIPFFLVEYLCQLDSSAMSFALVTRRHNSSFIKNVMEQVKKEVDQDPKMRKAWDEFAAKKQATEGRFQGFKGMPFPAGILKNSEALDKSVQAAREAWSRVASTTQPLASKLGESIHIKETFAKLAQIPALGKIKSATGTVVSKVSAATHKLGLNSSEKKILGSYDRWRVTRDASVRAAQAVKAQEAKVNATVDAEPAGSEQPEAAAPAADAGDGLVVSDRGNSSWDRFGANMRDMPFLNAFFSNPLMDSLFGETEISASIRQMREDLDSSFNLAEFVEEIETIVTPKFVKWYLEGNAEKLKHHCGEAAFAAVNASITARDKQKLKLDTNILAGPSDFELKAAKSSSAGESAAGSASPLFVFTFNAQQINCLRDAEGTVVEGAVDDSRQLHYAIAVQRSPKAHTSEVDFPWQIQEVAILGNQPCW